VEYLRPIRARALELLEDERHLVEMLHTGADKARTVASATVAQSYKNLGLVL
jgi:tryptophanyl-tRNA synthetase